MKKLLVVLMMTGFQMAYANGFFESYEMEANFNIFLNCSVGRNSTPFQVRLYTLSNRLIAVRSVYEDAITPESGTGGNRDVSYEGVVSSATPVILKRFESEWIELERIPQTKGEEISIRTVRKGDPRFEKDSVGTWVCKVTRVL